MFLLKQKGLIIALFIILFGNIILVEDCHAKIYKYVDKNGTPCFTDSLHAIPEEYRKDAIEIEDRPGSSEIKSAGEQAIHSVKTDRKEEKTIWQNLFRSNLFKSIIVITVFLFFFIIAGKVANYIGHGRAATIIRIVLTFLLLVYLFNLHAQRVINTFIEIKGQIMGIKKQVEERDEKINKLIMAPYEEPGK